MEEDPKHPKRIQTVWGVGYQYEEESEAKEDSEKLTEFYRGDKKWTER